MILSIDFGTLVGNKSCVDYRARIVLTNVGVEYRENYISIASRYSIHCNVWMAYVLLFLNYEFKIKFV